LEGSQRAECFRAGAFVGRHRLFGRILDIVGAVGRWRVTPHGSGTVCFVFVIGSFRIWSTRPKCMLPWVGLLVDLG
jgi:hypothetical protein